jgi:hypothetical protein
MPELTVFDLTDKGTLRPDKAPLESKGDEFVPIKLPYFNLEINLLENTSFNDSITLFFIYYISKIINIIVKNINNYI